MHPIRRRPPRRPKSRSIWLPDDTRARTFARRDFLKLGAAAASLSPFAAGCLPTGTAEGIEPDGPPKNPPDNWLRDARVAGYGVGLGEKLSVYRNDLDALAAAGVNVVEADADLSSYLTDDEFDEQLETIDLIAYGCHLRGMRCVCYYPTLEVLSPDAATAQHVMTKEHPDWLQVCIDGKLNTFTGGGIVFWVDPGTESAWMCPLSGYRQFFLDRVRRLAKIRIDGMWGDVPLLSDIAGIWPCTSDHCRAEFKNATGMTLPSKVDWTDPVFRRWVQWRHQVIWDFEQDILKAIKETNPTSELIIETVTMDYNGGTSQGLDGAFSPCGELVRCWEVDAVSDQDGMRSAGSDDWICMAIMMRHGACSSFGRPSWIFTYGYDEDDAERVMALAIATRNNPYETKIPLMCTTVGDAYRKRMYDWMGRQPDLYSLPGANGTAIFFSSTSRDFLDRNMGIGLYASLDQLPELWWSDKNTDSARDLPYLGDYRGVGKALIHAHVPFDIVPVASATAQMLASYKLLFVPSAVSLSSAMIQVLTNYVSQGGTLVVTGSNGGMYDEYGGARPEPALLSAFGLSGSDAPWFTKTMGKGKVIHTPDPSGQQYFKTEDAGTLQQFGRVAADLGLQLSSTAPKEMVFDLRRAPEGPVLVCANLLGLGSMGLGVYVQQDATFNVSLPDEGKTPSRVFVSEPTAGAVDHEVPFKHENGLISFDLTVHSLSMVRVTLG